MLQFIRLNVFRRRYQRPLSSSKDLFAFNTVAL